VGQVTRAYPWLAEVTLVTDKGQFVPVQNVRNDMYLAAEAVRLIAKNPDSGFDAAGVAQGRAHRAQ